MTQSPIPNPQSAITTYPPSQWRLLLSPPTDGPMNMAIDEAILLAMAENQAPPTLRFFAWDPPCLSLGYAQPARDVDRARLRAHGWDLVRRATGGRAILHTDELTYSIIAPMDEPRVLGGILESYRQLSAGLMRGVELLGLEVHAEKKNASPLPPRTPAPLPVCFEVASDYEITTNGKKLLGSAQVRKRGVVLQHGTLPLTGDLARIVEALRVESESDRATLRERVMQRATTVEAVLNQPVSWEQAMTALRAGFAEQLNLTFELGELSNYETGLAEKLRAEKYAGEQWNSRV